MDSLGNPLRILLSAGNINDITMAPTLIEGLKSRRLLADKGYDSMSFVTFAATNNREVVIPSRTCQSQKRQYDSHVYKERHLVECLFNKLKHFRRIATRYEKLAQTYLAMVTLGACLIWLR